MVKIEVRQLKYDLTPVAGLALVGDHFKSFEPVFKLLDNTLPVRAGVANSDILRSYLGLLVQGKSDFDAIENHRGDKFYKHALGIELLPSSPTLRQRMDAQASALIYRAGRLIKTGRKLILGLGASDRAAKVFGQMHQALAGAT